MQAQRKYLKFWTVQKSKFTRKVIQKKSPLMNQLNLKMNSTLSDLSLLANQTSVCFTLAVYLLVEFKIVQL